MAQLNCALLMLALLSAPSLPAHAADGPAKTADALPEPRDPAVRERERQALIAFYNAMSGPDWIQRDFWGSDRPVGEWHGASSR